MNLPAARTRSWRYLLRGIVALLCVWAGVLVGAGTHAAEHPTALQHSSSLSSPGDESLVTTIKTSLSMATVRTDIDRGSFKPIYLAAAPQSQTRLGLLFQTLERAPHRTRYVFHQCCVAQAGGTRAPPIPLPFPCLLSL
ncbi:MAG: hypothetical protein QM758_22950 [Armatimonas sp.]